MGNLPQDIKLTRHARERLEERNNSYDYYNTKNLMRSSCKWYTKDDFIPQSKLYLHCIYVCRKSKQMGYLTDGNIEVIYNKNTGIAITVMEVKEKFLPITQFIRPGVLKSIEIKKERKKKMEVKLDSCPDCGKTNVEVRKNGKYAGLCDACRTRMINMKSRGKEYIPYINLSDEEKAKIDNLRRVQALQNEKKKALTDIKVPEAPKTIPVVENYYQVKAEQNPAIAQVKEIPVPHLTGIVDNTDANIAKTTFNPLSDKTTFVRILRECGCEIPEENLEDVLNVLMNTDKLKDIFMTIAKSTSQQAMLDLEQALNVVERKLQHDWEYNGFQETDDIKFKGFLTWRRVLKGAIFFWKKLYQTNCIIEMQRAWNAYTQDPNEKVLLAGDRIDTMMKRYQITTESISTIFNTRRPFTRVFYASSKEKAYEMFIKWMADRQLHEDKSKTTITELKAEDKNE